MKSKMYAASARAHIAQPKFQSLQIAKVKIMWQLFASQLVSASILQVSVSCVCFNICQRF